MWEWKAKRRNSGADIRAGTTGGVATFTAAAGVSLTGVRHTLHSAAFWAVFRDDFSRATTSLSCQPTTQPTHSATELNIQAHSASYPQWNEKWVLAKVQRCLVTGNRQTDRQTDRQTKRQTHTDKHTDRQTVLLINIYSNSSHPGVVFELWAKNYRL